MDKRFIIFIIMSFAVIQLTMWYVNKNNPQRKLAPASTPTSVVTTGTLTANQPATAGSPATGTLTAAAPTPAPSAAASEAAPVGVSLKDAPRVSLTTEVYEIEFTTRGGVPVRWDVTDRRFVVPPAGLSKDEAAKRGFKAHEALIDPKVAEVERLPRPFETVLQELNTSLFYNELNFKQYEAARASEGKLTGWRFTSPQTASGLRMVKTYLFDPKGYTGKLTITLVNNGTSRLAFSGDNAGSAIGLGLTLGPGLGQPPTGPTARYANVGPVIYSDRAIESPAVKKPGESKSFSGKIDWAGVQSMYFLATVIPDPKNPFQSARSMINSNVLGTLTTEENQAHFYPTLELFGAPFQLDPGQQLSFNYDIFSGPKQREVLKAADHDLSRILFYNSFGWMRALVLGLMSLMAWFHRLFGNWGIAIILLTFTVRLITFPLVQKGMKAQAKMAAEQARLKPLIDKINAKYKDDPQRKQQEVFKLYKEHGVNPFGMLKGCVWMLIQIPIFFALYKLIYQSIDIRGAHFLWIADLAQADKLISWGTKIPLIGHDFNLLPIITAVTQMLASKFSTNTNMTSDPQQAEMQKMMMYFMPIFILFITYSFPAGLMLYWLVSNLWQVLQQLWVNKHIQQPPAVSGPPAAASAKA